MAGTTTTPDNVTPDSVTPEAVSGWSIFWALAAIVSHAMLQASFTGYAWSGNSFHRSLWPHRSSPFICLVDGIADGYLCLRALLIRKLRDKEELSSGRNGALTRLALFTLGVLPQAIKLFAMRGIPVTQAIAAMYLLPSVLGLVCSLIVELPERDHRELYESWQRWWDSEELPKIILGLCGWLPHLVGTCAFYSHFVDRVGFSASDNVVNAVDWLRLVLKLVFVLYIGQNMIFALFDKRPLIRCYPILVILASTDMCGLYDLVTVPGKRLKRGINSRWDVTLQQLVSLCLGCYLCAGLFYYLKGWIYSRYNRSVSSESLATVYRAETPAAMRAQGLSWAPGSGSPPNDDVEPLQQPLAVHHQTLHNTDNGDVAGDTTELGHSAIASTTSTVPEVAQNDGFRNIAPPWLQQAWKYLQFGLLLIIIWPWFVYLIIDLYLHPVERHGSEHVATEQHAAEEGVGGTSAPGGNGDGPAQGASSPPHSKSQELGHRGLSVIRALGVILRRILRSSLTLIWRLFFLGCGSVYIYTLEWARRQATERYPAEILINAFGLLNFSLAVLYYLVFFDGEGTSAPAWSDMFG